MKDLEKLIKPSTISYTGQQLDFTMGHGFLTYDRRLDDRMVEDEQEPLPHVANSWEWHIKNFNAQTATINDFEPPVTDVGVFEQLKRAVKAPPDL